MLRQGAQHALLLCAEACWLAPNTMPWMHCSTPCWLVQYCQCADWRAGCASPRVARVAREARLSFNPAAHVRRGSCSTGCGHRCGKKRPPSALLSPAFYDNFRFIIAAELYLAVSLQLFATEAWRAAPLLLTRSAQLTQPTVRLPQL